jgi:hypothetical protein
MSARTTDTSPTLRPTPRSALLRSIVGALAGVLVLVVLTGVRGDDTERQADAPEVDLVTAAPNPVTPGNFTGYGFDQCLAPSQKAMNTWLNHSPFLAVGIYISGKSRACRSQPNITPTWIATQLAKGWRLLPITLGPQASCSDRFPRYDDDPTIISQPGDNGRYGKARRMGRAEAKTTVAEAGRLGIVRGSTLWYDLEAFDIGKTRCRESAMAFLSAWTWQLHELGYVSGVYSSAGSGIKMLDDARVERPDAFALPDRIWIARWDGVANTSTSYIREAGWRPGNRMKQYQGGHNETWGGVTINIDRNYLDLGRGSVAPAEKHCGGVAISSKSYPVLRPATATSTPPASKVSALQCLLKEQGVYDGKVNGVYNPATVTAVRTWQGKHGFTPSDTWSKRNWVAIHSVGPNPVLKVGSAGPAVRRLQRAINAATTAALKVNGRYDAATVGAVRRYQDRVDVKASGIVASWTWKRLDRGEL